jgi:hypothetical protein
LILGTLVVYTLLVATHLGEFWPFSIYPMFSQGGRTWSRALVRDVSALPPDAVWDGLTSFEALPGAPYPLDPTGINQNDLANFVSKSRSWSPSRVAAIKRVFGNELQDHRLLVMRVEGRIDQADTVALSFTPFILLTPDSAYFNPNLSYPTD